MKIGLIGCGTIGQFLLQKINQERALPNIEVVAVFDEREKSVEKLNKLASRYTFDVYQTLDSFLKAPVDLVVECATIASVNDYASQVIEKKNLLVISIGALANQTLYEQLEEIAKLHHTKLYLPTGAVGGLDLIKAANGLGGLRTVSLTSRKPIEALGSQQITTETILFQGTAKEAIEKFPKNANVAIAISLAGVGVEKTTVRMIADPLVQRNVHTIQLEGEFGQAELVIENNPSPSNPKTSYLTSLSILSVIQSLDGQVVIG